MVESGLIYFESIKNDQTAPTMKFSEKYIEKDWTISYLKFLSHSPAASTKMNTALFYEEQVTVF